jgi:CelD/BcsL family acetyltransferase involved in cellulose biosynthesis
VGQAERGTTQAAGVEPEVIDLERFAPEQGWLELAERHGDSYFQTPDWVLSWWETLAGRPRTSVAAWRGASGELDALVVLSRDRERLHRRLPLAVPVYANAGSGVGDADHCAWLVPATHYAAVARWLDDTIGGSALLVRGAAPDWPAAMLPAGARTVVRTPCPQVALPAAPATGQPSKELVKQLRRFTRRLERKGVRFEWVAPPGVDEPLLEALFELHAKGREGRTPGSFRTGHMPFHRRLCSLAAPGRGPGAVVARRGEQIVGVLYGFWWRDTFAGYQSGWDRQYARDALGNVLVLHALEFAADHGARRFDFLRGPEPYKYRFGARDEWDRTWLVPRGPAGALLVMRYQLRGRRSTRRSGRPAASPPI